MRRQPWLSCAVYAFVALCEATPCSGLAAQAFDSTGMPSLERLAFEAGRASRSHPIRAIAPAFLCEPTHPLVDSASVAACAALPETRVATITAEFARGLEVPLAPAPDAPADLPPCPKDFERTPEPRVFVARLTAPVAGVLEKVWEARLTVELRCRPPGDPNGIRILGKSYLYQWKGSEWKLYQFSWWRSG